MERLGTLWNVTPYPGSVAVRTTLAAECDPHVADGRGYLVEAPDAEIARRMAKEHGFQMRGYDPQFPIIWTKRRNVRPIMRAGSAPCYLGFGTVRECPNICKGTCGYAP